MCEEKNKKIESQQKIRFELGEVQWTRGAKVAVREAGQTIKEYLLRHRSGDWGEVIELERRENELSTEARWVIASDYTLPKSGKKIRIMTLCAGVETTVFLTSE